MFATGVGVWLEVEDWIDGGLDGLLVDWGTEELSEFDSSIFLDSRTGLRVSRRSGESPAIFIIILFTSAIINRNTIKYQIMYVSKFKSISKM